MSACGPDRATVRLGRLESSRLAWAFVFSITVHLVAWGGYESRQRLEAWVGRRLLPSWIQALARPLEVVLKKTPPPSLVDREPPLVFVDVSPHQATTEPPKKASYYSSHNSQAANEAADRDTGVPKIAGDQTQVARTEDAPRNRFDRLQPALPAESAAPEEAARPKPAIAPGDLALARPELNPRQDTGAAEKARPRTLKEAQTRQPSARLAGQKMKQDGGVKRLALVPSLDAKATPFGVYDAAFIMAVQDRWFNLLDNVSYDGYRRGKVVVQFHLNYDGRITEMKVMDNTVGETLGLLCQKAVLDPAPFDRWPREMRLMVGEDFRRITFTFYYN